MDSFHIFSSWTVDLNGTVTPNIQNSVSGGEGKTRCKMASNLLFIQFCINDPPQNYEY